VTMPGRPPGERDRIAVRVRGGAVVPGFGELVENRLMGKTGFLGAWPACSRRRCQAPTSPMVSSSVCRGTGLIVRLMQQGAPLGHEVKEFGGG